MTRDPEIAPLTLGQTLAWAAIYYLFPALLLHWEETLGWSKADLTGAITLGVPMSALASPAAGRIIDLGKAPVLLPASACLSGLGLLALSMVTQLWHFYLVWGVIGIAMAGCLYEPCFALITRTCGQNARAGIIFVTLMAGFASTLSFPTMHVLTQIHGLAWQRSDRGWRGVLRGCSAAVDRCETARSAAKRSI